MTQGEEPGRAPADGPPWPALPPDAAGAPRPDGLAVLALVLAVVSLLVPVLPGLAALVLAAAAARRARALAAGSSRWPAPWRPSACWPGWGLARWSSRSGRSRPAGLPPRPPRRPGPAR